jgi:hypothetical protein
MEYVPEGVRDDVYEPERVIGVCETVRDFVRVVDTVRLGVWLPVAALLVARGVAERVVDTLNVRDTLGVCVRDFTPVAVIQDDGLTLGVRADETLFNTV